MSRHDDTVSLRQMLDHAREASDLLAGRSREHLDTDRLFYLGVLQLLQIIGEAANRVSQKCRDSHPEISWSQVISLRNRLIHGYNSIDLDIVWRILTVDVPKLAASLERILRPK